MSLMSTLVSSRVFSARSREVKNDDVFDGWSCADAGCSDSAANHGDGCGFGLGFGHRGAGDAAGAGRALR